VILKSKHPKPSVDLLIENKSVKEPIPKLLEDTLNK
jgi:hypothetical protein